MIRNILGVVAGYAAMFVFIFISFTLLYLMLGANGAFEKGTYQVSAVWIIISLILGSIAALAGGYICMLITKNRKAVYFLAALVVILGAITAIPAMNLPEENKNRIREGDISNFDAMQGAQQPVITLILNPIIGAAGVIAGGMFLRKRRSEI